MMEDRRIAAFRCADPNNDLVVPAYPPIVKAQVMGNGYHVTVYSPVYSPSLHLYCDSALGLSGDKSTPSIA
jgi:hypothetical protein